MTNSKMETVRSLCDLAAKVANGAQREAAYIAGTEINSWDLERIAQKLGSAKALIEAAREIFMNWEGCIETEDAQDAE